MFLIPDTAWKFGCGRYIQKAGALAELGAEVLRHGHKPLLISGVRAWNAAGEAVLKGLGNLPYEHILHSKPCCEEFARSYAALAREKECDVIVGIGGGLMMDVAKLTAELAALPVLTVPTISATCAAFAPLSVVYTEEGRTRGTWFYENEVAGCLADLDILCRQPLRYAAAGMVDSLAKAVEIRHNLLYESTAPDLELAKMNAEYLFSRLKELSGQVAADLQAGKPTRALEEMVYLTIPTTGVVSGMARGKLQSALGHCLYESVRTVFTREAASALHGELVGIGLRMLLKYDCGHSDLIDSIMEALHLPMRLRDTGIALTDENVGLLLHSMLNSSYTEARTYDEQRMRQALLEIW